MRRAIQASRATGRLRTYERRPFLLALSALAFAPPQMVASPAGYRSLLNTGGASGDRAPKFFDWGDERVQLSGSADERPNLGHALRLSPSGRKLRAEVRNTPNDRRPEDGPTVRRSEVLLRRRAPYGRETWVAFSVLPRRYTRPSSMLATKGGVLFQIKAHRTGSPVLALRRERDDRLRITTRNDTEAGAGVSRYLSDWRKDQVHDVVLRAVFDRDQGELDLWLDGRQVVSSRGIGMGVRGEVDLDVKLGAYYASGLGPDPESTVVNEFANLQLQTNSPLLTRLDDPPLWPRN